MSAINERLQSAMRGTMECVSRAQGIAAENVLLLAQRGALAKLFACYLLTFCAVSQLLFVLKGSWVLNLVIYMPANCSFSKGGNDGAA